MNSQHSADLWMGGLSLLLGGIFFLFQIRVHSFGIKDQATLAKLRTGFAKWAGPGFILAGCAYLVSIWL